MLQKISARLPYFLGMWWSIEFVSIQTIIILVLRFIYYDVSPFVFMPYIGVGFIAGVALASFKNSEKYYRLSAVASLVSLVVFFAGLHFNTSLEFLFLYCFLLFLPLGFALTTGFYLHQAKRFYKYELVGSLIALFILSFVINYLSVENILLLFICISSLIHASLNCHILNKFLVIGCVGVFAFHLTTDQFYDFCL